MAINKISWVGYVVVLALCSAAYFFGWANLPDLKLIDGQFSLLRELRHSPVTKEVVVVGIDENTVRQFDQPMTLWHPHLGRFFTAMASAQPAVVGLDLILPDRSYDSLLPGYDKSLLTGLLATKNIVPVILGMTVDQSGKTRAIHAPFASLASNDAMGYVLMPLDADQIVRRFDEHLGAEGDELPTLVGQMSRRIKVQPGNGMINYALGERFNYIPLHELLLLDAAELRNKVQGKAVLLGSVLPFEDRQHQPVNLAAWENDNGDSIPGILIQAQALRSILNGGLIATVSPPWVFLMILALTLIWFLGLRPLAVCAVLFGLTLAALALGTILLGNGYFLPLSGILFAAYLAGGGRALLDAALNLHERIRLRQAFSGYVSPLVMQEILSGRFKVGLGGERQNVCVMFADIRGFTTLSEAMEPEKIINFLNRYFENVTDKAIHDQNGTVICLMGDGLMAVFGIPKPVENPSIPAFAAARNMLAALAEFNATLEKEGMQPLTIGIGLNAGNALAGHIGSKLRHEYTAIGDTTNVASRVQGLTKELGYALVCTRSVVDALGHPAGLVPLGMQSIKGHTPVEVYGWKDGTE
jgi:class 3 adenylate cyclase/CHASE2 domain-containing sensor protein